MIAHTIEWLARHGVDEVVFSLGYHPDAFRDAFPQASWAGVRLSYAVEPEPLDTAGAIRFAAETAGALDERLIVVNGDILTDLDVTALVAFHDGTGGEGTIHLTPVADPSAYGVVPTESDGRVIAFIEKPAPGSAPTNLINGGTYILDPAAIARIASDRKVSIEREIFPAMVADHALYAMADESYWIDTGTPATYMAAQFDVLSGRRLSVAMPAHHDAAVGIHLCDGARLDGSVEAPLLIGGGAVIEFGATVASSILGENVFIEAGAHVWNSVILDRTTIRAGARVSDSVVGSDAVIGAGAIVAEVSIIGCGIEVEAGASFAGARFPE
jgi:mannose-1-phosphate guanylyltransferase